MDANMDMDVAWCLTCSKRTVSMPLTTLTQRDARSTYCSDACRLADTNPPLSAASVPLTSPLPNILSPTSRSTPRLKSTSPGKAPRPTISPLVHLSPEAEITPLELAPAKAPRDRRAFSFPAPMEPTSSKRASRQSSNVLPPFARKSSIVANLTSPPLGAAPEHSRSRKSRNRDMGATLPDSVFLSTSESSDEESPRPAIGIQLPVIKATVAQTLPDQFSTLRSQLSSRSHLRTREAHSPVAAMVASSASSRSREDIISWAKAVGSRPDESDDDDRRRGRSRTRRRETLANLPPPSTEPLDEEHDESTGPGTTPKGRIGSALAGLGMTGFVKALTGVTSPKPTSVLGLQAVPAPAEVSRIAVVASTAEADHYPIGATPTLSTISFSEIQDPSVMGTHDHVDVVTDDQSMASDYFRRSSIASAYRAKPAAASAPKPPPRQVSSIWNLSSYLRSLAPFSISSVIAPYAPFAAAPGPTPASSTPSLVKSPIPPPPPAMPAPIRTDSAEATQAHELVRSLPMDIMLPQGLETQPRNTPSPRSRRSHSRSKSRSRRGSSGEDAGAQWSTSEEGAEGDAESEGRGRSRRGKVIGTDMAPPPAERIQSSRSRHTDSSRSRGRGRDRAVRAR